ncbi:hypothetical protein [Streptomyces sp. NPDC096132]
MIDERAAFEAIAPEEDVDGAAVTYCHSRIATLLEQTVEAAGRQLGAV